MARAPPKADTPDGEALRSSYALLDQNKAPGINKRKQAFREKWAKAEYAAHLDRWV